MTVTFLFVDDDSYILRALQRVLNRQEQVRVLTESDPRRALERAGTEDVDVIVSDRYMPGLDGVTLLRRVGALWPTVHRVLMTGADADFPEDACELILPKPWAPSDVIRIVAELAQAIRSRRTNGYEEGQLRRA